jgi:alpha-glucuronidase
MVAELRARGHNVTVADVNGVKAVVNAVVRKGGKVYGTFTFLSPTRLRYSARIL